MAIHIMVHGAPGRLRFSAGDLSLESLAMAADELAAMGRALQPGGNVRFWSCEVGAGEEGEAFLAGLARPIDAEVCASSTMIGARRSGRYLETRREHNREGSMTVTSIPAPLTSAGVSEYPGLPGVIKSDGPSRPIYVGGKWSAGIKAGKYFIVWNNAGTLEEVGSFIVPVGLGGTFAAALTLPAGSYSLDGSGLPGSIGVYSGKFARAENEDGWSVGSPEADLTESMTLMAAS